MINSKRSLMQKLHEDKNSLEFMTISSIYGKNIGEIRQVGNYIQTNAFTLLSKRDNEGGIVDSWIYIYDKDVEVKNNHIYYYKHNEEHTKENIEIDIEIIEK